MITGVINSAFSRSCFVVLSLLLSCAAQNHGETSQQPEPDGIAVSSNQDVALCRPKGRCFIPEPDDPIFIGDTVETYEAGRFDFLLRDTARLLLLTTGKARIDRGSVHLVEIELLDGTLVVETFGGKQLEITVGELRCRIDAGRAAITQSSGLTSVVNDDGTVTCFSIDGATLVIDRHTTKDLRDGMIAASRPTSADFWRSLSIAR